MVKNSTVSLKRLCPVLLALLAVFLAAFSLSSSPHLSSTGAVAASQAVELIPRQVLSGNPDRAGVQVSRDGTRLSFLAPVNGVLNVWVGPVGDPASAKPVTNDTGRGILSYTWAYTNNHILYSQDTNGDENYQIYSVDVTTGQTRALTSVKNARAGIHRLSDKFPQEILIDLNDRDARFFDLYRLNIVTGERTLLVQNEGFADILVDNDLNVRFAQRTLADGGYELLQRKGDRWVPFTTVGLEDESNTYPVGFDKSNQVLYMVDSRGRNTSALTTIRLDTGVQNVIAEDSRADLSNVLIQPTTREIQAADFTYDRDHWRFLDPTIAADFDYLRTVADGEIGINSRSLDDRRWIVIFVMDNGPVRYYLYDRDAKKAQFLFTHRKALEGLPLANMHPVIIKSRDGLDLVSYLTLPVGSNRDGGLRPDKPLPMVLSVHGGPWARDYWGLDIEHQWLANRGYAVLSVNFRGSAGFGKAFLNAGNLEWGAKMHDDLIDGVQWAIREGIADPKKICIVGGSYGGYATLVGMTFTPETFACGVDSFGPSSLVTLLNNPPSYWYSQIPVLKRRVGDQTTDAGRAFLNQRSPLTFVDRITKPLLIGQGANDVRVKPAESEQIVKAMEAKKLPVTYVVYLDEGHGFVRPPNRISFDAVTEAFLAQYLGGRVEPIGDALVGSTITVPVGANLVPGLAEALASNSGRR